MKPALFVLALGLWPALPAGAQELAAVDDIVGAHVGEDAPGIAVAVLRDGAVLHLKGYGFADLAAETPVTADSIFDLASLSKQMTALAAMRLIAGGTLSEETAVGEVLPELAAYESGGRAVTVGDLVHHLSGFPDYLDAGVFDYRPEMENAEVIAWLAGAEAADRPGRKFAYSNTGYLVLGSLVAAAAGAGSLAEVLEAKVWGPLEMASTSLVVPADAAARVTGYAGTGGDFAASAMDTVTEGDGNVYATIADLARYEAALAEGTLLGPEATAALFANGFFDDGEPIAQADGAGYGHGWHLFSAEAGRIAAHDGSWMGTATAYRRELDTGLSVVVLSNGEDLDAWGLAEEIAGVVE